METSLPESTVSPRVPATHANGRTLFPDAPIARRPLQNRAHLSVSEWLRQSIPDLTLLGHRIFRAERDLKGKRGLELDGDPLDDGNHLGKILRGENGRKFSADWLFHFADEYGVEGRTKFLTWLCDEWGFSAPALKPDPLRAEQRRAEATQMLRAAAETMERAMDLLAAENARESR